MNFKLFIMQYIISVTIFALIYYSFDKKKHFILKPERKDKYTRLTILEALYFSLNTQTGVGYGDIVPGSNLAKIINMIQQLGNIILFTL